MTSGTTSRAPGRTGPATILTRSWRGLRWYLREVTGESAYDRYLEHERREHAGAPVLTRGQFERRRQDLENARPQQRCC